MCEPKRRLDRRVPPAGWLRQLWCGVRGHLWFVVVQPLDLHVTCLECGMRSSGVKAL